MVSIPGSWKGRETPLGVCSLVVEGGKRQEAKESWDIVENGETPKQETEAWFPVPSLPGTQRNLERVVSECQALRVLLGKKCWVGLGDTVESVKDALW